MTDRRLLAAAAAVACALVVAPAATAFEVPAGAAYSQGYITQADGTSLHYDLLRPRDLPTAARTPTILSIGPYFGHGGQTGVSGPAEGATYDPVAAASPSDRFRDFIDGAQLMRRGYSWIQFDLRGFGASGGCLDWAGPGEQADVKAAVEWTAAQPWSTGKVGMYGKSYDAVTGLIGAVSNPRGLAAVVAQEPVYDLYRYLYADGVRYQNSLVTPALYSVIDATGGSLRDDPHGLLNQASSPACYAANYLAQQSDDHASSFWRARDLISRANDVKAPLLLTQGFLENNTKPDGAFEFWSAVTAPKRAWFGMWDHVRANDVDAAKQLKMGRQGWFDEVMRFYDHYVRDVPLVDAATDKDPPVALQTSDGTWRSEARWPPADARDTVVDLWPGGYIDDAANAGTSEVAAQGLAATPGNGVWTISPPLPHDAHLAGVPRISAELDVPLTHTNFVADVYDIAPAAAGDGSATLISRNARRVDASGRVELPLYGDDWVLPAGHRIGVLLSGSNMDWWLHIPTGLAVTVRRASIALPFLMYTRPERIEGATALRLTAYRAAAPFTISAQTLASATKPDFLLPAAQVPAPVVSDPVPAAPPARQPRVMVRIARRGGHRVVVYGNAPSGYRVAITVRRGTEVVLARRTVTARVGAFRATLTVRPRGRGRVRVRALVVARRGQTRLTASSALLTLRRR